jgi:hypothetical protein
MRAAVARRGLQRSRSKALLHGTAAGWAHAIAVSPSIGPSSSPSERPAATEGRQARCLGARRGRAPRRPVGRSCGTAHTLLAPHTLLEPKSTSYLGRGTINGFGVPVRELPPDRRGDHQNQSRQRNHCHHRLLAHQHRAASLSEADTRASEKRLSPSDKGTVVVGKEGLSFPYLPVYNPNNYSLDHQVRREDGGSRLRSREYQQRFGPTASVREIRAGASRSGRGAGT